MSDLLHVCDTSEDPRYTATNRASVFFTRKGSNFKKLDAKLESTVKLQKP